LEVALLEKRIKETYFFEPHFARLRGIEIIYNDIRCELCCKFFLSIDYQTISQKRIFHFISMLKMPDVMLQLKPEGTSRINLEIKKKGRMHLIISTITK